MNIQLLIQKLKPILKTFDSDIAQKKLLGEKVFKIIKPYFDRLTTEQLASALITRWGPRVFKEKKYMIFTHIINSLDNSDLIQLSNSLNINLSSKNKYQELIDQIPDNYDKLLTHFGQSNFYIQQKIKDTRKATEEIQVNYEQKLISLGYPHPYQNSVKLETLERFRNSSGAFHGIIVMPTGSGKTRTAVELMIDHIRAYKNCNIAWLVDSPNLCEQSLQTFKKLWELRGDRKINVSRIFDKFNPRINFETGINVMFCGFQKIHSLKQQNDNFYQSFKKNINLMIIDEAHHSLAETYEEVITDIQNHSTCHKIGLTATPLHSNDNDFFSTIDYFGGANNKISFNDENDKIIDDQITYLQDKSRQFLAKLSIEYFKIPPENYYQENKDFNDEVITRIKKSIEENKKIIVFAISKYHAIALDIILKHSNIKSECITGDTPMVLREGYFSTFKDKTSGLNILINFDILATGIDLPSVDELFLLRKFNQYTTAMQVLGRGLRGPNNGGNKANTIISLQSNQAIIGDESSLYNLIKNMYS